MTLVAILDADKEGFLRSETSLIQTIGRAARNVGGQVIMYADHITGSMQRAIDETNRRREKQVAYNEANTTSRRTPSSKPSATCWESKKVAEAQVLLQGRHQQGSPDSPARPNPARRDRHGKGNEDRRTRAGLRDRRPTARRDRAAQETASCRKQEVGSIMRTLRIYLKSCEVSADNVWHEPT